MRNPLVVLQQLARLARESRSRVVSLVERHIGEQPTITFTHLRDYYLTNPAVKSAVDNIRAQWVGGGFHITAASGFEAAKELVDGFNEDANIDEWFQLTAGEMLYAGTSITEYPEDWKRPPEFPDSLVPLSTVQRVRREPGTGRITRVIQQIDGQDNMLDAATLILFTWNAVDRRAFGVGLLHPLATTRKDLQGDTVPALLDIMAHIDLRIKELIDKLPPRYQISYDVGDEVWERKFKPELERMKGRESFATNAKVDVKELTVSSRADMEPFLKRFLDNVYMGLETPLLRALTEPSAMADLQAALDIFEPFRAIGQRFLKRRYERLVLRPLLQAHKVDWRKAQVRLHWGQPAQDEITFEKVILAAEKGILRVDEARKMLLNRGWELEQEEPGSLQPPPDARKGQEPAEEGDVDED